MAVWMVRAGRTGDREEFALENGLAVIGWDDIPDMSAFQTRDRLENAYQVTYPQAGTGRRRNHVGQLWALSHRIAAGDLIVLPLKRSSMVAVGRATGTYQYRTDLGDAHHTVPVQWLRTDLPRTAFDQDLLYSFGAFMTVCRIQRNNAEARIKAILAGEKAPVATGADADVADWDEAVTDIEQVARDQISAHIIQKFKGHEMTRLVDAILRAEGYKTHVAPHGADGGVDILAGGGPLGFSQPKLCVQVKSQQHAADVTVFRNLQGCLQTFQAEQGLLVCWGGFNSAVTKEARLSFFKIRLWDAGALVEAVLDNYDRLPEDLQTELPLKRVWALVLED